VILLIRLFADWEFSWWKYIFFVNPKLVKTNLIVIIKKPNKAAMNF